MSREMKESGIDWIGSIPKSWNTIKFKYLHGGMNTGEGIDKNFWSNEPTDRLFYTAGINPIRTNYEDFPEWKYTKENDLLLARNGTPYIYIDLEGKLKLEYYKLQKTFEGAIKLEKVDGQYVPSKKQGAQGIRQKSTLDEILDKINEKYKGQFTDGDRVMLGALHDKLIADDKLASSARTSDPRIFTESIFPSAFGNAAMESYMEAQDSYSSLFEDKSKYDAVMSALAGVIYREMRSKKTVDYRKIERDEQVQMVAEEPVKYGE